MEYIKDFVNVYKVVFEKTAKVIRNAPLLVLMPLFFSIVYGLIQRTFMFLRIGRAGVFVGVILGLIEAMLLSGYFSKLEEGINYNRLNLNSFFDGFIEHIWSIYFMRFIFYLFSILTAGIFAHPLLRLASFILFNAAGEAIYLKNTINMNVFAYPVNYLKDNWYLWLPHVAISVFVYEFFLVGINMNPLDMYIYPLVAIDVRRIILLIILGFYFIFRGVLFKETANSSMRKRKYMGII